MTERSTRSARFGANWAVVLAAVGVLGCGAADPPREPTNDDFRWVQRQEAIVDEATHAVRRPNVECAAVCDALDALEGAVAAICELARETVDQDLSARCEQATLRAEAAHAEARCRCGEP